MVSLMSSISVMSFMSSISLMSSMLHASHRLRIWMMAAVRHLPFVHCGFCMIGEFATFFH